jgi:prepilin-type N-terminal cleavage/methylation domain-containing protein
LQIDDCRSQIDGRRLFFNLQSSIINLQFGFTRFTQRYPMIHPCPPPPRRGFSLVELMVVVGIIALLTGLLLTVTPKIYKAVYGTRTLSQLQALSAGIENYHGVFNSYPGPLANNQLGIDLPQNPNGGTELAPYVLNNAGQQVQLTAANFGSANPQFDNKAITGPENLVLGLLGGLKIIPTGTGPYDVGSFVYDPTIIFPDQASPAPVGASSLAVNNPKQQQAFMQVRAGDITAPNYSLNNGRFTDAAGRAANDTLIPEFLDKYADPLPILYIRTNVGAKAVAGIRGYDDNGTALTDPAASSFGVNLLPILPQYDLLQILGYTSSGTANTPGTAIGTVATDPTHANHGLRGIGAGLNTDTIMTAYSNSAPTVPNNNGKNGYACLRDPSAATDSYATNTHSAKARQPDGYLLISAGPDRLYGVPTDLIYPGGTLGGN